MVEGEIVQEEKRLACCLALTRLRGSKWSKVAGAGGGLVWVFFEKKCVGQEERDGGLPKPSWWGVCLRLALAAAADCLVGGGMVPCPGGMEPCFTVGLGRSRCLAGARTRAWCRGRSWSR